MMTKSKPKYNLKSKLNDAKPQTFGFVASLLQAIPAGKMNVAFKETCFFREMLHGILRKIADAVLKSTTLLEIERDVNLADG
jgi:hypothetical protein